VSKFWKIKNEAGSANVELYLYGQIAEESWNENDKGAKEFADDLLTCEGKDITLRINSPGGNIFSAQAIYNVLKAYPGKVTAHIDGICASAATVVACGAAKVVMPKNALYMIHNPMTYVFDMVDAEALSKMADTLAKVKETIVNVYKDRAGVSRIMGAMRVFEKSCAISIVGWIIMMVQGSRWANRPMTLFMMSDFPTCEHDFTTTRWIPGCVNASMMSFWYGARLVRHLPGSADVLESTR
jgi:ATP-dependent protease ClpP protease subunit